METIYDHHPTQAELQELTGTMTKEAYLQHWMFSKEHSILDIVLLYEMRKDETTAKEYRVLIPELYQQWKLGLDNFNFISNF